MPDVKDVYEMVTKQKPSDPGALERQRTRQVRTMRNRRIYAFGLTAAIVAAAVAVLLGTREQAPTSHRAARLRQRRPRPRRTSSRPVARSTPTERWGTWTRRTCPSSLRRPGRPI